MNATVNVKTKSSKRKQYVLVIHGTANAPEEGVIKWYQPDEAGDTNFTKRLNDALEQRGAGRSVWRGIEDPKDVFSWSAGNSNADRVAGAASLASFIRGILKKDPRALIHLVAHSHGGNVSLLALELLQADRDGRRMLAATLRRATARTVQCGADPGPEALRQLDAHLETEELEGAAGRRASSALAALAPIAALQMEAMRVSSKIWIRRRRVLKSEAHREWSMMLGIYKRLGSVRRRTHEFIQDLREQARPHRQTFSDALGELRPDFIGQVVFLGTPFYEKSWTLFQRSVTTNIDRVIGFISGVLMLGLLAPIALYLGVMVHAIIASVIPGVGFIGIDPLNWPAWLKVAAMMLYVGIVLAGAGVVASQRARRDGNLYSMVYVNRMSMVETNALVVHAGKLDEAILALSAVPLTHAYLLPSLTKLLAPRVFRPPRRPGLGANIRSMKIVVPWLGRSVLQTFASILMLPLWPIRWLGARVAKRVLANTILKITTASAYGIDPAELNDAAVRASERLVARGDYSAAHWDVTNLLAATPIIQQVDASPADRYAFLWDDRKLHRSIRKSETWKRVRASTPRILGRQGLPVNRANLRDLHRTCLMIDTRLREIGGGLQLAHSCYYSNQVIIDAIADFIAAGNIPQDAEPPPKDLPGKFQAMVESGMRADPSV